MTKEIQVWKHPVRSGTIGLALWQLGCTRLVGKGPTVKHQPNQRRLPLREPSWATGHPGSSRDAQGLRRVGRGTPERRSSERNAQGDTVRPGTPGSCRGTENPTPFRGESVKMSPHPAIST